MIRCELALKAHQIDSEMTDMRIEDTLGNEVIMSMNVYVYSTHDVDTVNDLMSRFPQIEAKIADGSFLLSTAKPSGRDHESITSGFGFHSKSFFLVYVADSQEAEHLPNAIRNICMLLGENSSLALFENETIYP